MLAVHPLFHDHHYYVHKDFYKVPHYQNDLYALNHPDLRIRPKIVGKNIGYLEGTCYECLLDDERDLFPTMCYINDVRFTEDIIITPKRFMMIGIVFKYMFTRKYDLNYYSSMELDKESLKVGGSSYMEYILN